VTFKIINRLKFNNDHLKLNDNFKCHITFKITLILLTLLLYTFSYLALITLVFFSKSFFIPRDTKSLTYIVCHIRRNSLRSEVVFSEGPTITMGSSLAGVMTSCWEFKLELEWSTESVLRRNDLPLIDSRMPMNRAHT
jgi:integral membrane sensor domain MASE1